MHAIVCIKQVPDTTDIKINPETGTLVREGVESIVNPFDEYAIEEGLRLKERFGGKVTVISMGPPQAETALKKALAMGADEVILLSDRAFAGADTLATSYTLSETIKKIGDFDVVICGREASDGATGQVGPGIARRLDISQLTYVFKIREIDFEARTITVERLLEEGREVVTATLPALLAVVKDINQPRYPTFMGIRKAAKAKIPVWTSEDLGGAKHEKFGLDGSATKVIKVFTPPPRVGKAEIIKADTVEEAASTLAEKLLREKII
ncbi:MAG: electron transfer flavoprotein subunit beta/FixA family protein [Chloroflexota bacterium]|nr:electron transfer flavoprotein subunit beta/FixA family protein [Chloroflexota bacterium]